MLILNPKQELFAQYVAQGKSHRQAAIDAGYSQRSATCIGSQLVKQPRVAERIRDLRDMKARVLLTGGAICAQLNLPTAIYDENGMPLGLFVSISGVQLS